MQPKSTLQAGRQRPPLTGIGSRLAASQKGPRCHRKCSRSPHRCMRCRPCWRHVQTRPGRGRVRRGGEARRGGPARQREGKVGGARFFFFFQEAAAAAAGGGNGRIHVGALPNSLLINSPARGRLAQRPCCPCERFQGSGAGGSPWGRASRPRMQWVSGADLRNGAGQAHLASQPEELPCCAALRSFE